VRLNILTSKTSQTYTAAIFDFEGTLVDFQWQLKPAEDELRRAFAEFGFGGDEFAAAITPACGIRPPILLARQGRLAELRQALCPIYEPLGFGRSEQMVAATWCRRTAVPARGRRRACGHGQQRGAGGAHRALTLFEFRPLAVPGRGPATRWTYMKPRAEGILRVLSDWQVAAGDVLFIGDSRADVFGARAAGMPVAIIRGGECDEAALPTPRPTT